MIKRFLENRILKAFGHFPAAAILGPRQVGKTTLARMIRENLSRQSFYIDLENPDDQALLTEPQRFFSANSEKCIIIDEIQRKPDLFPILRSVIDQDRKPGRFLLLGSASPELLFLSSETLTGRIIFTELTPFLAKEINGVKSIQDHWLSGGFPEPCLVDDPEFRKEWFRSFIRTYVERDFRLIGLGAMPTNIARFFSMLAHVHGYVMNKSMMANSIGLHVNTVNSYLDYFKQVFLIRELTAWNRNIGKRLVKSPKIYIRDSGLVHFLHRIDHFNDLLGHPIIGHSWEGYIIEQIISSLGDKYDYFFYRTQDGTECDLILVEGTKPKHSIEIKYTSAPKMTKGFTTALKDLGTRDNFILVPDVRQAYSLSDNVMVYELEGLLKRLADE